MMKQTSSSSKQLLRESGEASKASPCLHHTRQDLIREMWKGIASPKTRNSTKFAYRFLQRYLGGSQKSSRKEESRQRPLSRFWQIIPNRKVGSCNLPSWTATSVQCSIEKPSNGTRSWLQTKQTQAGS